VRIRTPKVLTEILSDEINLFLKIKPLKVSPGLATHDFKSAGQNALAQPGSKLSACAWEVVDGCFRSIVAIRNHDCSSQLRMLCC